MGKRELAEAEILVAEEKLMAFMDDYKGKRWRNATVSLYFAFEHIVKALLADVGFEAKSHEGLKILFSMHFIKSEAIPPKIGRYLNSCKKSFMDRVDVPKSLYRRHLDPSYTVVKK
jgi:uncharacterized protein (UPF0332 family)